MAGDTVQQKIDDLKVEVERETSLVESVKTYVSGLLEQIEGSKDDPDQLQAIIDAARANNDAIAAVVPSNTPAEG